MTISRFRTSLDTMSKIISLGICLMCITIGLSVWFFPEADDSLGARIWVSVLQILIITITASLMPFSYELRQKGIQVNRLAWNGEFIRYENIHSAEVVAKVPNKGLIRVFGNGGLFGYYGAFRNTEWGHMTWYLTRRRNVIVLSTGSKKILLSPDDPGQFLEQLNANLKEYKHLP